MTVPTNDEWAAMSDEERAAWSLRFRREHPEAARFGDDGRDPAGVGVEVQA